jgi:tetratricopeptide (TPR) repeat protein/ADP-heptose:LPS heptosyltransferase
MSVDIEKAVQLHANGDKDEALKLYIQNLKTSNPDLRAFMNAPVLLRANGKQKEAINILKSGIKRYPKDAGLYNNLGNAQSDIHQYNEAILSYRECLAINTDNFDARHSLIRCLFELGHRHMAYGLACKSYDQINDEENRESLLILMIEIILWGTESGESLTSKETSEQLLSYLESTLYKRAGDDKPGKAQMMLATLWIQMNEVDKAIECNKKITHEVSKYLEANLIDLKSKNTAVSIKPSFQQQIHGLNWAISILLLKRGRLKEGWKLFDHGLRVKATGPQKYQRALFKPFSTKEVKLWKGENLQGKNILLLAEQGIGDTMMFATLLPALREEGANIFFYCGPRLDHIYKRSLEGVTLLDRKKLPDYNIFDYQSPLGSVPQYRFNEIENYAQHTPVLKANLTVSKSLRKKYYEGKPLVGISWQGGAISARIPLKSVQLNQLLKILSRKDVTFVSLQYGDLSKEIENFCKLHNVKIINDKEVDPLRDMDRWLSQVDAMDYVISVANTTIHGAGGLGKPTFCLVSNKSDWRWIDSDVHNDCYWYKSVNAGFQQRSEPWDEVIDKANKWLSHMLKYREK